MGTDHRLGLSWVNHVLGRRATAEASEQHGDLAPEAVRDPRVTRRWRLVGPAGWWQADFAADRPVDVLALRFPRDREDADGAVLYPEGQVRHRLDPDGGTPGAGAAHTSPWLDLAAAAGHGYHLYRPPEVSARWWRVELDLVPGTTLDLGLAWAGRLWQPAIGLAPGWAEAFDDLAQAAVNPRSGARFVDPTERRRLLRLPLAQVRKADRPMLREALAHAGTSGQLLAVRDPAAEPPAREALIGRIAATVWLAQPRFNLFAATLPLEEDL